MELKEKLRIKIKSDKSNFDKFWNTHIRHKHNIGYFTFMNQLAERSELNPDIEKEILKYIGE